MATTSGLPLRWMTLFLDSPAPTFDAATRFWCEVTGSGLSPARGAQGEFATLLPPSGTPWLRVQRLASGAEVDRSRLHLDLHLDLADRSLDDGSAALQRLGAGVLHREDGLVMLCSPGGFVFCLVDWDGEALAPAPVTLDAGGASRADQVCLDIPPELYETECDFWASLTGWPLVQGSLPDFRALNRPDDHPLRILLQRRQVAEPGDRVSAHLDLACDDRDALAERHQRAGATLVRRFSFWTTLRDPAGRLYCLTPRDPRTSLLRPRRPASAQEHEQPGQG